MGDETGRGGGGGNESPKQVAPFRPSEDSGVYAGGSGNILTSGSTVFVMQDNFSCLEIMNLNRDSKHRISKEQGNPVLVRAKVLHPGNWVLLGGWGGCFT